MPRRKSRRLSPATAMHLIEILIREGKLLAREIGRYLRIAELEERLRRLRGVKPKTKSKRSLSAAGHKSHQIQGRYIAYIRRFPKSARAKYQKIAREQGREKAIVSMKKALAK